MSRILNDLLDVIQHHRKTTHFTYTVVNSESQIVGDNTTDIPLIHGILELEISRKAFSDSAELEAYVFRTLDKQRIQYHS